MQDVVIVGARCAGSPLAMLLARRGCRVALFDRDGFPSDVLSTHVLWPPGVAALHRWNLWRRVAAAGAALCHVGITRTPGGTLRGPFHRVDDVDYTVSLRRFKLDVLLVEAAIEEGVTLFEGSVVEGLLRDGQDRVIGVTARDRRTGRRIEARASVVVGADGRHSTVARLVGAGSRDAVPPLTANYHQYVEDFPGDRDTDEIHTYPSREYLFSPCDDGLTLVNLVIPTAHLDEFRRDVPGNFSRAFDLQRDLGERLRAARPLGRIRGTSDVPNFYRSSCGPGWALAGDAAYCKDPIRAQGMTDAFLDAEGLAGAIARGLSGERDPIEALREHEDARRRRTTYTYRLCLRAARFELAPVEQERALIEQVSGDPSAIAAMRGLICGSMDPQCMLETWPVTASLGRTAAQSRP
jgi:2-polyprenyl-6-methoxyphenol hydroxylase-like FAD-dependent oxidoreductase